jgi:membrane protein implicated in regulation of membrane protease activity
VIMVHPSLCALVTATLALTESVQLEIVKVVGLAITSVASVAGAYLAYRNSAAIGRRRKETREDPSGERVTVVEERRKRKRGRR